MHTRSRGQTVCITRCSTVPPPLTPSGKTTHLCEAGKIHQCKVEDIGAVYAEVYGQLADALVLACDAERLLLDLAADLVEVGEALVDVEELAPLGVRGRGAASG